MMLWRFRGFVLRSRAALVVIKPTLSGCILSAMEFATEDVVNTEMYLNFIGGWVVGIFNILSQSLYAVHGAVN